MRLVLTGVVVDDLVHPGELRTVAVGDRTDDTAWADRSTRAAQAR